MKLKIQEKKIINCSDWDEFVSKAYDRPYCLQQQNDCYERGPINLSVPSRETYDFENTTVPEEVNHEEMGVSLEAWKARDPNKPLADGSSEHSLQLWWLRNFYPSLEMVANDLHSRGLLDAGEYIIIIDW